MKSGGNIILTGYRATGKSSVGRSLARRLGREFVDMDQLIENRQGSTIRELVAARGWPHFRQLERELLQELAARRHLVIATGGGAVLHQDLWPQVKADSLVVWLRADRQEICKRLAADANTEAQRPSLTGQDVSAEIEEVLAAREPLYRRGAHLVLETAGRAPEELASAIERALANQTRN